MRIPWSAGSGSGVLNSSSAGNGLTFSAGAFNVGAGTGITVNANDVEVNQATAFAWTDAHTLTKTAIGTAATPGYTISNTTAAAAGAQQYSPMLVLDGRGWKTDSGGSSRTVEAALQLEPVQGAADPTGVLRVRARVGGSGAWSTLMSLDTAGTLTTTAVTGSGTVQSTATSTFALYAPNGGVRVKGSTGYDSDAAETLIVGATTATGVRVGKSGGSVGFYGTAPATIQNVTGSRGGNAALASLLTALATVGLVTDGSSA